MPFPRAPTAHRRPREHSFEHDIDAEKRRNASHPTTGKTNKRRRELNVFRRLGVVGKRQSQTADAGPDYTQRWPTVTTLLDQRSDSWFFHDTGQEGGEEEEPARPVKARALRALAAPLGWLNVKLESMQEHLDYKILLSEARAQKRASRSSSRRNSEQPGQSTHPYDTGIAGTINEEEEETSRRNSQGPPPACQVDARNYGSDAQMIQPTTDNKPTLQTWKKIRFGAQSDRESRMQHHTSAFAGLEGLSTTDTSCSPTTVWRDSDVSVQTQIYARPTTSTSKPRRNLFSFKTRRTQHAVHTHDSPNEQLFQEEVASITNPKWKRTKDRRGSAYPGKDIPARRSQDSNEQSATSQQKASPGTAPCEIPSPRTVVKKASKSKISRGSTPQSSKLKSASPRLALSQQPSRQPVLSVSSGPQRRRSSANRAADAGTMSAKSCTPAARDSDVISPRAGAFRHLLGLIKDSPPSRAISPLEIDENDTPSVRTCAPLTARRRSTDTTTSSGVRVANEARAQSNENKTADGGASHHQKKEGGWLGMPLVMPLIFGISSKEHTPAEPITQPSTPVTAQSTREVKTSSRRASAKGTK
jgi:hypothetical protein